MSQAILPYFSLRNKVAGAVDYVDVPFGIRGWLVNVDEIGRPQSLSVHWQGDVLATSTAILDRPDIDEVLKTTTQCGFLIGWSRFDRDKLAEIVKYHSDAELKVRSVETLGEVPVVCAPLKAVEILRMVVGAPQGDLKPPFKELNDYLTIVSANVFDAAWFARHSAMTSDSLIPPILRYVRTGEGAGFQPNLYFDPVAYAMAAELPRAAGALVHYIRRGEQAGIEPSLHFDPRWYVTKYGLARGASPLAHYLANRATHSPNRWFDVDFYRGLNAAPAGTSDLYEHFVTTGARAGLPPSAAFVAKGDGRATVVPPEIEAADYLKALLKTREQAPPAARPVSEEKPAKSKLALPAMLQSPRRPTPSIDTLGDVVAVIDRGYGAIEGLLREKAEPDLRRLVNAADMLLSGAPAVRSKAALVLAIAYHVLDEPVESAKAQAAQLSAGVSLGPELDAEIRSRFLQLNHALYQRERGEEARGVYHMLYERGDRDYLVTLRLLEIALERHDEKAATKYHAALMQDHAAHLNVWGQLSVSRFHHRYGSAAAGLKILKNLPTYPAIDLFAETVVINRLIESDALDEAKVRLEAFGDDHREITWARLRLHAHENDFVQAGKLLDHEHVKSLPDWQLAETMYQLTRAGIPHNRTHRKILNTLYDHLAARGWRSHPVVQSSLHYLVQSKRWDLLKTIFEELETTEFAASRETQLRRLEYACFSGQPALAEEIYRANFQGVSLTKWEGLTVLRLLSELKKWKEANEVILAHLKKGFGFAGSAHQAIRLVRRSSLHEAISQLVVKNEMPPVERRDPDLADFLRLVQEDHSLVQSARAFTGGLMPSTSMVRSRSHWTIHNSGAEASRSNDHCTFMCTNQRYFLSLLTFMCSYLGQSPQTNAQFFVFLDKDVPRQWYAAITTLSARFNQVIEVISEQDFLSPDVEHRTEYGFFTGGSNLARTAYFRIYAAQYLLSRYSFSRALYIDSDIVCRGDLSKLFRYEFDDKLVAARIEDYTIDVQAAADLNNLDAHEYFNSGVLLLRFDDDRMPRYLLETSRLCEEQPERLAFHDQCALNIAFQGQNQPLPAPYNFFLRPHLERNGYIEDGLLLHYLDRPKPWDLVFDRSYREEWRVWALLLSSILPQNLYVDIYAAANRD